MCGIAGALDLTGKREFPLRCLHAMTNAIAHRGPDDEHVHVEPGVALGARRLAILDIAHGRQPIANESKTIWAAFNGQLFNYPELRDTLLQHGHQLKTHCDTESWVHLYEDYKEKMFEQVKGQFALSLWDRTNQLLLLARDRLGICPLYYAERDGWLLWGSEIKALLASGLVLAKPDLKGIDHLFNFFCAGTSRTFFADVKLLPPGHFLRVKNNRVELHQYWDLDFPHAGDERQVNDPRLLVDELDALLNTAVKRRLRADVPVVSYLSGGVDSTLILDITRRQRGAAVPSFTIGLNRSAGSDERNRSAAAAKLLGSDMTTLALNSTDIAQAFPALITAAEGPVLDTSCAALMELAAEVNNQNYKVALTGEGADEALAGYFWFKTQKISEWMGPTLPQFMLRLLHRSISPLHNRKLIVPTQAVGGVRPAQQYMYEMVGLARESLYSEAMWDGLAGHDPYADMGISHERMQHWHPLNQSLFVGYKMMLAGLLMMSKGDRIAMRSSVEMRYPYLDEDVVTFCASIHPSYKLHGMRDKWLLREVASKTLPRNIAYRSKKMFRSNLSRIFLNANRPAWVDQLLSAESLNKAGYFDPKVIAHERWIQAHLPRITPRQFIVDAALTCAITTQLWHHIFCGGGLCDLPTWTTADKISD